MAYKIASPIVPLNRREKFTSFSLAPLNVLFYLTGVNSIEEGERKSSSFEP